MTGKREETCSMLVAERQHHHHRPLLLWRRALLYQCRFDTRIRSKQRSEPQLPASHSWSSCASSLLCRHPSQPLSTAFDPVHRDRSCQLSFQFSRPIGSSNGGFFKLQPEVHSTRPLAEVPHAEDGHLMHWDYDPKVLLYFRYRKRRTNDE